MNTGDIVKDERSQEILRNVKPAFKVIFEYLAMHSPTTFILTEGLRTTDRQRQLVAAGASRTMASKHLTGDAVDVAIVVDGEVRWDWPLYENFAREVYAYSVSIGIPIQWGGDWPTFKDGPHYELK